MIKFIWNFKVQRHLNETIVHCIAYRHIKRTNALILYGTNIYKINSHNYLEPIHI